MDDMLILSVVAGILTTIAFIMMYRDAREQKEIFAAQEAEEEARAQAEAAKKPVTKKSGKKR